MNIRTQLVGMVVGLCVAVLGTELRAAEATKEGRATLGGKVIDLATGKPAEKVAMALSTRGREGVHPEYIQLVTDEKGEFKTTVPRQAIVDFQWDDSPGDHALVDNNWRQQGNGWPLRQVVVDADRTDLVIRVKLIPTAELRGRVVGENGAGAPGVSVYVFPRLTPAVSDSDGKFMLERVPKDRDFDLIAVREASGFMGFSLTRMLGGVAQLKAGEREVTIKVGPARTCEGRVTNGADLAAGGLSFSMAPKVGGEYLYQLTQTATTNAEGKFVAKRLVPGALYFGWWTSGNETNRDYDYGNMTVDLATLNEGEPIRFVAMQHINTLLGKVVNEKGEPVKEAMVRLRNTMLLPQDVRNKATMATTDEKGEFLIQRLGAGKARLVVGSPGYKARQQTVATDSVDFVAKLKKAEGMCEYRVAVVDETGQALKGATVEVLLRNSVGAALPMVGRKMQADVNGVVKVEWPVAPNATDGWAGLVVCDIEGRDVAIGWLPWNTDLEVRLLAGKLARTWRGRIVNEQAKAVAGAEVKVTGIGENAQEQMYLGDMSGELARRLGLCVQSDAEGRFELRRLGSAGQVSFQYAARGYVMAHATFTPGQDAAEQEKQLTLVAAGGVKGRVVLKGTGQAPPGEGAMAVQLQGTTSWPNMEVAKDWTFSSDVVTPGAYVVKVDGRSNQTRKYVCVGQPTVQVESTATAQLVIEVEEGIRVHGKLVNAATGKAMAGTMMLQLAAGNNPNAYYRRAGADGSWETYVAEEGEYSVRYHVDGTPEYRDFGRVQVGRGRANEVEVKAEAGK